MEELGMRRAIVPVYPGVLSACGLVEADLEYQHVQSILRRLDDIDEPTLQGYFDRLEARCKKEMADAGIQEEALHFNRAASLRYRKQLREVTIELGNQSTDRTWIHQQFCEAHERLYGYATDEPIEVIGLRVACVYPLTESVAWSKTAGGNTPPQKSHRQAYFEALGGFVDCAVYRRNQLRSGVILQGPVIVEQEETNTVVCPGQTLTTDVSGNLYIENTP
jgi:N-methylhydantoinase A